MIDRAYDARNDLLDECDRNGFAVPVTLRLRDSQLLVAISGRYSEAVIRLEAVE